MPVTVGAVYIAWINGGSNTRSRTAILATLSNEAGDTGIVLTGESAGAVSALGNESAFLGPFVCNSSGFDNGRGVLTPGAVIQGFAGGEPSNQTYILDSLLSEGAFAPSWVLATALPNPQAPGRWPGGGPQLLHIDEVGAVGP